MGKFKEQVTDELMSKSKFWRKAGDKKLADDLEQLANLYYDDNLTDVDIANSISASRGYFSKKFDEATLEGLPIFRKTMYDDLTTGEIDYDKAFGKNWYKNFQDIPLDQIKFEADKRGLNWRDELNKMAQKATENMRRDISRGEENGGWFEDPVSNLQGATVGIMLPRSQAAVAEGRSPSEKDVSMDIAQTALEAVPYGQIARSINNPIVRRLIGGALSNAAAPVITEAADASLYDRDVNYGEMGMGTAVNALGSNILKGTLGRGATALGMPNYGRKVMTLGEAETRKDLSRNLKNLTQQAYNKKEISKLADRMDDPYLRARINKITYNKGDSEKAEILRKLRNYDITKNRNELLFTDKELRRIANDPDLKQFIDIDINYPDVKSGLTVAGEEAAKNLTTNKIGASMHEQGQALTRLPIIGSAIQRRWDEYKQEQQELEDRERILNELRERGLIYGGR